MASEAQQKMLWAIAHTRGLTTPRPDQVRWLDWARVNELRLQLEQDVDVFASRVEFEGPQPLLELLERAVIAHERIAAALERISTDDLSPEGTSVQE